MLTIRFTAFAAAPAGYYKPGDVAEIEDELASAWVDAGIAQIVPSEQPAPVERQVPETPAHEAAAVTPRNRRRR